MPAEGPLRDRRETSFHLIETMRCEPGMGIVRCELHKQRLVASAQALGFDYDPDVIDETFANIPQSATVQRLRLILQRNGQCDVQVFPFQPAPRGTVWTVQIAKTRLASNDPFLRHKTSRREVYDAARAEIPAADAQEVLLLNERDEICEGTITNVFARFEDGTLRTPPLSSGLLAGVLRAQLLRDDQAQEKTLTREDLQHARELYVGNSLRGLIPAVLL